MTSTIAFVRHDVAASPPGAAFDSREAAIDFFAMPELKEAMSQAGVKAESVEISYFDEIETGALVGA